MDKSTLPQWGWLVVGLFATAILAGLLNVLVLYDLGLGEDYEVLTTIAFMAPVVIYVGIWQDEDRSAYFEHSRAKLAADLSFVVLGALAGAGIVLAAIVDVGPPRLLRDVLAMIGGFVAGWALFWFRNTELYGDGDS